MVMVSMQSGLALLLLCSLLIMPSVAKLSRSKGNYLLEPLRRVSEWSNRVQAKTATQYYSKELSLWNESWPKVVKLKHELSVKYGRSESADRPYALSNSCLDGVLRLVNGLSVFDSWALEMVDSSGKLPSGIFLGNVNWIGTYEECLEVSSEPLQAQQPDNTTVLGKYCLVKIGDGPPAPGGLMVKLELRLGICIPRSCNSTDAMALINIVLSEVTDEVYATAVDCSDGSPIPLDTGAIAVIAVLSVLGALLLLGTYLDYTTNHGHQEMVPDLNMKDVKIEPNEYSSLLNVAPSLDQQPVVGNLYRFLIAFSVLANAKKVLPVESRQTDINLDVLNGIRFFSMSWIIEMHTYLFVMDFMSNLLAFGKWFGTFSFQPLTNGTVCVDNFFLLSGTLSSYILFLEIRAKDGLGKISWPYFYFHRIWRLTPLYMLVLAIYTTLFKYFGSGPFWPKESDEACINNWWTNLLYINNVVHHDSPCIASSWYMANDLQFFLLLPIFVALLYKCALLGGIVIFVLMLASSITTGVQTYVNHYPPSSPGFFHNISTSAQWYDNVYPVPWCRINPYLIGILLGYILYKSNGKLKIHKALVVLGWCLAAACNISILYGLYEVGRGHPLSPYVNALYASVHRTAWSVGVAWVILACATGNGGFVNRLLSLPIMQPLGRLTFSAYLVQEIVIFWYYQNLKEPVFANHITMTLLFLGYLVLAYAVAFVFFLLIEAPTMNLDRSFLRNR